MCVCLSKCLYLCICVSVYLCVCVSVSACVCLCPWSWAVGVLADRYFYYCAMVYLSLFCSLVFVSCLSFFLNSMTYHKCGLPFFNLHSLDSTLLHSSFPLYSSHGPMCRNPTLGLTVGGSHHAKTTLTQKQIPTFATTPFLSLSPSLSHTHRGQNIMRVFGMGTWARARARGKGVIDR